MQSLVPLRLKNLRVENPAASSYKYGFDLKNVVKGTGIK